MCLEGLGPRVRSRDLPKPLEAVLVLPICLQSRIVSRLGRRFTRQAGELSTPSPERNSDDALEPGVRLLRAGREFDQVVPEALRRANSLPAITLFSWKIVDRHVAALDCPAGAAELQIRIG